MSDITPLDKNDFEAQLMRYRGSIDAIDKQMISLLKERMHVVQQVGMLKTAHNVSGSYIRPGREAVMMRELLTINAEKQSDVAESAIVAIWRIIIGCSTAIESPLNILTLSGDVEGKALSAAYFSPTAPSKVLDAKDLLDALAQDRHAVAVLPHNPAASYWQMLPKDCYIFACLPFYSDKAGATPSHLAVGYVTPEPTGDDVSVFYDATAGWAEKKGFHHGETQCLGSYAAMIISCHA
jgi:chorismate mutase / prephenate dehydratase